MWALDFQTDLTVDGRQVRFLNIIDEYTREALATRPFRSCTADQLCTVLDDIITTTGRTPAHIRMDNGTEMTAHAMTDGSAPGLVDTRGGWFLGRFCGRVDHLKLGWGEFAEGSLLTSSVVLGFDPDHDRQA